MVSFAFVTIRVGQGPQGEGDPITAEVEETKIRTHRNNKFRRSSRPGHADEIELSEDTWNSCA